MFTYFFDFVSMFHITKYISHNIIVKLIQTMEDNIAEQPGMVAGIFNKFGMDLNAKNGVIVAIAIVLIMFVLYKYVYPKISSSEGVESGKPGKKKKSGSDKAKNDEDDNSEDISKLVDKIESKQDRNMGK